MNCTRRMQVAVSLCCLLVVAGCGSGGAKIAHRGQHARALLATSDDYTGYYTWLENSGGATLGEFESGEYRPGSDEILARYPGVFGNPEPELNCCVAVTDYLVGGVATGSITETEF